MYKVKICIRLKMYKVEAKDNDIFFNNYIVVSTHV